MEPTWILVADAARARLFRIERPRGPLIEEADFVHPGERLPEHELGGDDPGRVRGPGGCQHAPGPDEGKRVHEAEGPTPRTPPAPRLGGASRGQDLQSGPWCPFGTTVWPGSCSPG